MNKLLIIIFMVICHFSSFGQWYKDYKVNKKAYNLFNLAYNNAMKGNYSFAKIQLLKSLQMDDKFVEAYLSLGGIYGQERKYDSAILYYEKSFSLDTVFSRPYLLPYSINLAGQGRFADALSAVNEFLKIPDLNNQSVQAGLFRRKTYQFAVTLAATRDTSYVFNPVNLGDSINTVHLEYYPVTTIDGKNLVFTRRIANHEGFYFSEKNDEGQWEKAKILPGKINSPNYNEGAQSISQDGKWLIFTGCNFPEGFGSCDLYISYLTPQGWSTPQNLGPNINTEFWESSPSLSPDKRDLYFSSGRPGGYGGMDIWVVHRDENGRWGQPENLGPEINTTGDESTPFIHADNQTLYFNSTGHPGYSEKADLFVTRKKSDGTWSQPENLGYPINTIEDEGSLFVGADGVQAFYSSDRSDGKGGLDIYTFDLPRDMQPLRTLWVQGKVFDNKTREGVPSMVQLDDLSTGKSVSKVQTDEDGGFLVTLPLGKDYAFTVRRKGYLFFSKNYDLSGTGPDSVFTAEIALQPIETGASIVLNNIFFEFNKTDLLPESVVELDHIVTLLNENPTLKIEIIGYTDNIGKPADNITLSKGRAVSVVNYLIRKGISPERLKFTGKGDADPVGDNATESGRALNRRTELKVIDR